MNFGTGGVDLLIHMVEQFQTEMRTRLSRVESQLTMLAQQKVVQEAYSTEMFAKIVDKAEYTVREWCRHGRLRATKRPCGRGTQKEWMISHAELERYRQEGLLPPPKRAG